MGVRKTKDPFHVAFTEERPMRGLRALRDRLPEPDLILTMEAHIRCFGDDLR